MDIVTDIDEWLTSDKTEQEIVDFVKELCHALGSIIPGFEATCNFLMESQLPANSPKISPRKGLFNHSKSFLLIF